jgi:hypothetical protein
MTLWRKVLVRWLPMICRFLVVGNIFRLETCMNSLVKVLPYSKLNFQGKMFFTQNWCNITLMLTVKMVVSRVNQFLLLQLFLCGTHEIYIFLCIYIFFHQLNCAWAIISPKEFKSWITRISLSGSMIDFFLTRSWSVIIGTKQPKVNQSPQRNGEDDKHAHGFADF